MKNAFIFDLDGTLANANGRNFYNPKEEEIKQDLPIEPVVSIAKLLYEHTDAIIFLSGREDKFFEATKYWIGKNIGITDPILLMRKTKDQRKDAIIKAEIYNELIKPNYKILGVFDDRKQVVDMWISLGLFVFDVAQGKGNF